MLDEKRIKEAEKNIPIYLEEGLLKKTTNDIARKIFIKNAKESLKAAKLLLDNNLLNEYEEVAEEALKIAEIKSEEIISSYDFERKKRNHIQYQTTPSDIKSKALTSFKRAQEFLFELEKI